MTATPGYGRSPQPNLLAEHSERVFLCRSAAENSHQLRSCGTQRLAFSFVPALSGQERVLASEGRAGETDGTFEQLILQAKLRAVNA